MSQPRRTQVWVALGLVYVIWGSTYLGIAVMDESMPPLLMMGVRFICASGVLALGMAVVRGPRSLRASRPELGASAVVGLLLLTGGIGILTLAERYVPTGIAALIVAAVPLWTVLIRTIAGDSATRITWAGIAIGLLGIALLVRPTGEITSERLAWSGAIVCGSILWSIGSFLAQRMPVPRDPLVLTTYEMLAGGLAMVLIALGLGERLNADVLAGVTTRSWVAFAYMVLVGSIVGYSAYVWLLGNVPLSIVTTYAYVNPVVAVFLGWLVLREQFTSALIVGGAITLVGVFLVFRGERTAVAEPELVDAH